MPVKCINHFDASLHDMASILKRASFIPSGCLIWSGAKTTGYGVIRRKSKNYLVHRLAWEWINGRIGDDLQIDHRCRNRACCNIDHMEVVTHRVNTLRGNTASSINARKTHCPKGHEYTSENTIMERAGNRRCKKCHYQRNREISARKTVERALN